MLRVMCTPCDQTLYPRDDGEDESEGGKLGGDRKFCQTQEGSIYRNSPRGWLLSKAPESSVCIRGCRLPSGDLVHLYLGEAGSHTCLRYRKLLKMLRPSCYSLGILYAHLNIWLTPFFMYPRIWWMGSLDIGVSYLLSCSFFYSVIRRFLNFARLVIVSV